MLTKEDIKMFYALYFRLDLTSPNIGVVGKKYRFEELINLIKKEYKNKPKVKLIIDPNHTKFTIIDDDQETSYIYIDSMEKLKGTRFRKYM